MNTSLRVSLLLSALAFAGVPLAAPASAVCSDRPGTPDQLSVEALSPTSIRFKFRITTRDSETNRFYDVEVEEVTPPVPPAQLPVRRKVKVLTGVRAEGPNFLGYGGIDHFDFAGLNAGKQHCARIRARTEAGTQGCVSALWARPACADTPPEAGQGRPPIKVLGKVATLVVVREGGTVFRITGHNFRPDSAVVIQVSGPATSPSSVTNAPGRNMIADAKGQIAVRLAGLCERDGGISFAATDGLKSTRTPARSTCRLAITKLPKGPVARP